MFHPPTNRSKQISLSDSLLSLTGIDQRDNSSNPKKAPHLQDSDSEIDRQSLRSRHSFRLPEKHELLDEKFFS